MAVEADAAAHRGIGGKQAHDRIGERALTAATFADNAEDLAFLERQR